MLSYVTSALAFSAPMSKTFDSKAAAAGAAAALSLVAMPVRHPVLASDPHPSRPSCDSSDAHAPKQRTPQDLRRFRMRGAPIIDAHLPIFHRYHLCHPTASPNVLVVCTLQAFAGDAGAGESVFSGNCAACHAGGQNVIMPEKTLEKAVCCAAANCTLAARWTAWACRAARFSRQGLWGLRG